MRLRIGAASAALLLLPCVQAVASPVDAIRAGDMQQMTPEIIAVYEDAGLSWDHDIDWTIGPFTTTFWYYSLMYSEIVVGAVPKDDEVDTYWQTWSDVLTDGAFKPGSFFASDDEARELAHYNQYVLATHESAHAMIYRYDFGHLERHDYAVNCREYYADRLTVAILNELAAGDPDMTGWRARYLELVIAMGDTIPVQYRHHVPDVATLDTNCAVIDVEQPTPETMQPYASAYFERYRLLLEAELPPLREVFATHLQGVWDEKYADLPLAPEYGSVRVATLGDRVREQVGTVYGEETPTSRSRAAAFDDKGTLWFVTLAYDQDTRIVSLQFGPDAEGSPAVGEPAEWPHPSARLEITSAAVLSPDRFLFALDHWEESGVDDERHFVSWAVADRTEGTWTLHYFLEVEDMGQGAVLRSPANRIFIVSTVDEPTEGQSSNWRALELSLEDGEVVLDLPIPYPLEFPIAIDEAGRIYDESGNRLWRNATDEPPVALTGDGLGGPRDGVGARVELGGIEVLQWMSDDRAIFLDIATGAEQWLTRELVVE